MLTMNALGTETDTIMCSQPHLLTPPGEAGRPGGLAGRPWNVPHPQVQALSARSHLHSSAASSGRPAAIICPPGHVHRQEHSSPAKFK